MDRREFLKKIALASAVVTTVDFSMLKSVLASNETAVVKDAATDMVAVMGGTPASMLDKMLSEFGGIKKFVKKGDKVVLKPNIGWNKSPEMSANTNPELVGAMVKQCLAAGASEVLVFDHTCDEWKSCYENSGIKKAVEAAGGKMIPGNDESYYVETALPQGVSLKNTKVHKAILDCNVWFNMPVLKHHGGAKLTISMKNYMGVIWDRGYFHRNDLQQCIADVVTFNKKPALHIVDAYRILTDNGPQGRDEKDVVMLKTLISSPDPVAADTAATKLFNQAREMDINVVSHISKGQALKLGTMEIDSLNVKRIKM